MTNSSPPSDARPTLEGIEVVELSEVDLDFAFDEAFGQQAPAPVNLESTRTEPAAPEELRMAELFRDLNGDELSALAPRCESIHAVPGYVLMTPGRLNSKVYFVLEGQLRMYAPSNDKRPIAIADVGQSTGLRAALMMQPANYAAIATELSHILAIEVATLEEHAKRSHALARNYAALLAHYLRNDNCLHVGARITGGAGRQGYIDELTLLHNQHWLDTVFPRLAARYRLGDKSLAVAAFAIDQLEEIGKTKGIGTSLRVLGSVGRWMLDQTRPTDILAVDKYRHIFAILPDCDLNAARQLGVRLKTAIQSLSIPLTADQTAILKPTISLGIAELEKGMKEYEFLNKTDALIRKSAKAGGNRLSETL